jgi:tetratricopeptide (TPR) repeat protein
MGVVYRARDKRLNRIVALKFLGPEGAASPDALTRFRREAELIAALNHPNIATLYEAGEWDGEPFLALEFLPGGTLKDRLRTGGLPLCDILQYASQLGAGLAFAHDQAILHRDVKPSNGMFSSVGALKLVDFGVAKTAAANDITCPGSTIGTITYMAPEVLSGEESSVRSDLYSFGALVYELATSRHLFVASRLEPLVREVLSGAPVPLATLRPDLPPAVCEAVSRATARNPKDRFESIGEFLCALGCEPAAGTAPIAHATRTLTADRIKTAKLSIRRRIFAVTLASALAVAGLSYGLLAKSGHTYPPHWNLFSQRVVPGPETIVVLPFENLGADPANKQLCDGLQETVTSILTRAEAAQNGILIVPSSEVRRNQVRTIGDARKQFNATLALNGSIQRNEDGFVVVLNLSDAASLRQKDSRMISVRSADAASLPAKLADELGSLVGAGSLLRPNSAAVAHPTANSRAYELYLQGTGAFESRSYDQAIDLLRKAVKADPLFYLARAKLSLAYLEKNSVTSDPTWLAMADAEVNEAAHGGLTPEVLLAQARIRIATGDSAKAIALFRQLLQNDATNVSAYISLADALSDSGDTDGAEDTFQRAIRLRPGYWPTYNSLGTFYYRHNQYQKAEQSYLTGLGIAPDTPSLHRNLGAVYFETGRWTEAANAFEKSLSIKPNALAYSNLGMVRFRERNYPEAAKQFELAVKMQPANPINWGNLGDARWQLPGAQEQARQAFDQAVLLASQQLALNPGNVRLRKSCALYLAKLSRSKEAVAEIERSLAAAPKDKDVQFFAARVYAVLGNPSRALAALREALALGYSAREIELEPDLNSVRNRPEFPRIASARKR